ncbi:MAG: NrsF family protein, partial [Aquabacterium commune]|uniref:NrsF family protein n=1 Tax=Aquabacterium commune TaxID=70586 RepID=UPI003BB00611
MKTDALIDMLARDAGPAPRALAARRLSPAAVAGLLVSAGVAVAWFGAIPAQMFATAVPWTKMAYAASLALAAAWLTAR